MIMIAPRYCRIDLDRYRRSVVTHHGPDIKTEHYQSEFLALEVLLVPDVLIGRNHHRVSRRGSCLEEFAVFKLRIKLLYDFGDAHAIIIPGKVSGAWVFRDTRLQVVTVIENLEDLSIDEVMKQFDVTREQITAVLEFGPKASRRQFRRKPRNSSMLILLDHGAPRGVSHALRPHAV